MKKTCLFIGIASFAIFGCSNGSDHSRNSNALREEAVAIHDEIMPQVSLFDRNTIKIDSLLSNLSALAEDRPGLDTTHARAELTALKTNLTNATESMMSWMHDFDPDVDFPTEEEKEAYYAGEVRKMEEMKKQFDDAAKQTSEKLAPFQ